jgi:hypothetical protein
MNVGGSFERLTASNQPSRPFASRNSLNAEKVDPLSSRKAINNTMYATIGDTAGSGLLIWRMPS